MKFQMEITKPYLDVCWHFYSVAWGRHLLQARPGAGWGWRQGWFHECMAARSPRLAGPHTRFSVLRSPS